MKIEEANQIALEILGTFLERDVTEKDLLMSLDQLGADSLDMLSIAFEVEKKFGVKIEIEIFLDQDTLKDAILAVMAGIEE
ncbi:acyl carrier protein [Alphaproteobacteria bacterium]|jgi:acyl carrier protein|nr:acyl carrier protein [Alphaproteobacteria bacterium]